MNSVFDKDVFRLVGKYFDPYSEKEKKVARKILELIKESDFYNQIKDPTPEHIRFQYGVSFDILDSLGIDRKVITFKVYDFFDNLLYQQYIQPYYESDFYGMCEYGEFQKYPELTRYELCGFSKKYNHEIPFQHWDRRFDKKMNEKLAGMYGIVQTMNVYNLIKDEIYKEVKRIVQYSNVRYRDPRTLGGRDFTNHASGWYQLGRRGVEGEMRNVTIGDDG